MDLYKLKINLHSPIITPLKGDTIWGHIVWGIANHEGNEKVSEFLKKQQIEPEILVSSAFPKDTICRPLPEPNKREALDSTKYAEIKKNKKKIYASAQDFYKNVDTQDICLAKAFELEQEMHNTINRFTGTVDDDGGLFALNAFYPKQSDFDIYIRSSYAPERITTLFNWAFENGYGADASTGKGHIKIIDEPKKVELKQESNTYMALAPFVVSKKQSIKNLRANIFIRNGKIGGNFATYMTPWKKTVVLFDEGAVFESIEPLDFVGELLTDIHVDKKICQAGFAPVIPIPKNNET